MKYMLIAALILFTLWCLYPMKNENTALRYKIGQMLILGFEGQILEGDNPIIDDIQEQHLGGVILFDYHFKTKTFDKNIKNPEQVKALTQQLQALNANPGNLDALPLIISVDYEGGTVNRLHERYGFAATAPAASYPNMSDTALEELLTTMADTLLAMGINLNFAPVVDLNLNPDNPIIGKRDRSFSASADDVSDYAYRFSKVFRQRGLHCTYKHFPGHGSSTADSHMGFVDVTETWQPQELTPYKTLVNKPMACDAIVSAHVVNKHLDPDGLPATLSHKMLSELLREELGFKGLIISDDMQMKAISDNYTLYDALVKSINAGVDVLVFGNQLSEKPYRAKDLIDLIEKAVHEGDIQASRIENAHQRIVHFKNNMIP